MIDKIITSIGNAVYNTFYTRSSGMGDDISAPVMLGCSLILIAVCVTLMETIFILAKSIS